MAGGCDGVELGGSVLSGTRFVVAVEDSLGKIFAGVYIDGLRSAIFGSDVSKRHCCLDSLSGLSVSEMFAKARLHWRHLISEDGGVAVAVSGGRDSMALAIALQMIGLPVFGLVVDHKLRDSSGDEALRAFANLRSYEIKGEILTWEHAEVRTGLEEKARDARYALLTDFCRNKGIKYLFTGHHLNDQVETVLINLTRGSGLDGLSGIRPISSRNGISLVRPMLGVTKAEIVGFCSDNNLPFVVDPSNTNLDLTRNKLRHCLFDIVNSQNALDRRIARTADIFQQERTTRECYLREFDEAFLGRPYTADMVNFPRFLDFTKFGGVYSSEGNSISSIGYILLIDTLRFRFLSTGISDVLGKPTEGDSVHVLMDNISKHPSGRHNIGSAIIEWGVNGISVRRIGSGDA